MVWTAEVTSKFRDPGNFNIVAEITYTEDKSGTKIKERFAAVDLTDEKVAEQARKRIKNVLEPGDAALEALSVAPIAVPPDPVITPEQQALLDAQAAFQQKLRDVQVAALGNPELDAAYAAVKDAQVAVAGIKISRPQ